MKAEPLGVAGGIWRATAVVTLGIALAACGEGVLSGGEPWPDAGSFGPDPDVGVEPDAEPSDPVCPRVIIKVEGGGATKVRKAASTGADSVGVLYHGTIVNVAATVERQGNTWYRIKAGSLAGYVSARSANCTRKKPPSFTGFYLPFGCGKKVRVTQGNSGAYSHNGLSAYAFDFSLGIGSKMIAMAPGTVAFVYDDTKPGSPCFNGGGESCRERANLVRVKHPDGSQTLYAHLSQVKVQLKQKVNRGQVVGLSGSTGYSTGPHAHVARMRSCCQTIPLKFEDVGGKGVPSTGDSVVSRNCP